jgi:hypothetical protein
MVCFAALSIKFAGTGIVLRQPNRRTSKRFYGELLRIALDWAETITL